MSELKRGRLQSLLRVPQRPLPPIAVTPTRVVHSENKWRLLHYQRADAVGAASSIGSTGLGATPATERQMQRGTPVLLVPSLINRHYVLDLTPGQSMVETMLARGHEVFIIDWGTPNREDRWVSFDMVCDKIIGRALRLVAQHGDSGKAHLLGYCLGGTLAVIHAAARPERVATLTALAAPVSFHDEGLLSKWVRNDGFSVKALVDAMGLVPWQLMQPAFQMLRPTLNLLKAVQVIDRAWDDEFLDSFFAVEHWGKDNVSLPGEFYRQYIEALYGDNALIHDRFFLSEKPVNLSAITCPVHAITFEHDNIVPHRSASVLLERVSSVVKKHTHQSGGHVGAVVSKKAATRLWPGVSEFWRTHD
jgi:polyhydroxyalkanoate synthase